MPLQVFNAGNTQTPAYLVLKEKGFVVRKERRTGGEVGDEKWIAEGPMGTFGAEDPVSLLGIVAMVEARGEQWFAPDDAIDRFLNEFYLDSE